MDDFLQFVDDDVIIFRFVWNRAVGTTLHVFRRIFEVSAALVTKKIKRTITKQAIEPFRLNSFMARKTNAIRISKKLVTVFHYSFDPLASASYIMALTIAAATLLPPFLPRATM